MIKLSGKEKLTHTAIRNQFNAKLLLLLNNDGSTEIQKVLRLVGVASKRYTEKETLNRKMQRQLIRKSLER